MIDLRLAYNDPSLSRIRKNPRQWKLFLYLLAHADEKGYVEMSLRQIADEVKMPFSTVRSMLNSLNFRSILAHISLSHQSLISICNIERYQVDMDQDSLKVRSTFDQHSLNSTPLQKEKEEKKVPPCTPFKEKKEKKDTEDSEVASLQQQQQQPTPSEKIILSEPIEKRRERFWADVCHSHALHPEWPAEGVRNFFLFWTQADKDGQFLRFEMEKSFGMTYRMKFFLKRGKWLDEVQEARLDRIKYGKAASSAEESYQRRRAAAIAEDDAGREERDRQRDERVQKAATVEEIKAILGDRWVGEN